MIDLKTRKPVQNIFRDDTAPAVGEEPENPLKRPAKATARGHRETRAVSTWTTKDLATEFGEEARFFFPMLPNRVNVRALQGALRRLFDTTEGMTPELALAMIDAFFWDRRSIRGGIPLWQQWIGSWSRLLPRAQATVATPRNERQGRGGIYAERGEFYGTEETLAPLTEEQLAAEYAKYAGPAEHDGGTEAEAWLKKWGYVAPSGTEA